jgi:hypothetical protein
MTGMAQKRRMKRQGEQKEIIQSLVEIGTDTEPSFQGKNLKNVGLQDLPQKCNRTP